MANGAPIQHINHRHEQIINWLLCNPHRTLGECAKEFGYTQAWLSRIVNSDLFQAELQRRAAEARVPVIHTVRAKLAHLAVVALDKAAELIESGVAGDRLHAAAMRTALEGLGYVGDKPQLHKHEHIHLAADLVAARERIAGQAEAKNE